MVVVMARNQTGERQCLGFHVEMEGIDKLSLFRCPPATMTIAPDFLRKASAG